MASYSVWLNDEESTELQKKLDNGEIANQFVKALVQKFLDPNVVVWNCSEEEIAEIDSKRNERSRDEYLRKLIQEERPESSKLEDEGVTKIDFRTLLGEELFIKVHAKPGIICRSIFKKSSSSRRMKMQLSLIVQRVKSRKLMSGETRNPARNIYGDSSLKIKMNSLPQR